MTTLRTVQAILAGAEPWERMEFCIQQAHTIRDLQKVKNALRRDVKTWKMRAERAEAKVEKMAAMKKPAATKSGIATMKKPAATMKCAKSCMMKKKKMRE